MIISGDVYSRVWIYATGQREKGKTICWTVSTFLWQVPVDATLVVVKCNKQLYDFPFPLFYFLRFSLPGKSTDLTDSIKGNYIWSSLEGRNGRKNSEQHFSYWIVSLLLFFVSFFIVVLGKGLEFHNAPEGNKNLYGFGFGRTNPFHFSGGCSHFNM